jgi:2-dehydro-3-deoxyphosphogalactonate aldolase
VQSRRIEENVMAFDLPHDSVPIIAILRGVRPTDIIDIASVLDEAGIRCIEVPLNSPDPLASIEKLCERFGDHCLCGAGTVLDVEDVDAVHQVGARLIVTPNIDPAVIERSAELGLTITPGFATATEAFRALRAGASGLKLFPAGTYGPNHLRALREVLPKAAPLFAVGGVNRANLVSWFDAGAFGVAVGGDLYRPGDKAKVVAERAHALVETWRAANTNV